ncbi:MAG: type VI secretion system membrane subunit TssM [Collimonas sp.]
MSKFFSLVFSRQAPIVAILILMAAIIWFLGPLLAVSNLHPLASMMMRVTVIALIFLFGVCLLIPVAIHLFAVATLCVLIWYLGPLLSFAQAQPLTSMSVRAVVIVVILSGYALVILYSRLNRKNKEPETASPDGHAELQHVRNIFRLAIKRLESLRGVNPLRWIFQGKRYLYQIPWYLVIGAEGSGKTSALVNGGLRLLVTGQLQDRVKPGDNPTEHCDIRMSAEAVLIDTAGRYTTQTADPVKDQTVWQGFLTLLRQKRELAPINGAILAVDIGALITQTPVERITYAAQIRTRLGQLRSELGIGFPCYVIVTKMDLLEGFTEYFGALSSAEREQAWGFTFPVAERDESGTSLVNQLQSQCQVLLAHLEEGMPQRLQCEFSADKRMALTLFPREFDAIIVPLTQIVDAIFHHDLYGASDTRSSLRGVYFTSAARTHVYVPASGLTIGQRHRAAQTDIQPSDQFAELRHAATTTLSDGKRCYFLSDVFEKNIIPEAHLVQPNRHAVFRLHAVRLIGYAVTAIMLTALCGALMISFQHNHAYLNAVADKTGHMKQRVSNLFAASGSNKMLAVPDTLAAAQELPVFRGLNQNDPSSNFRYGLYSAPPVTDAAHNTCARLADSLLLPQIIARMEEVITTAIRSGDGQITYDTLRVYLQLHDKTRYNANDLKAWVQNDWESSNSANVFGSRAAMVTHVNQLFSEQRVVESPFRQNLVLIDQARAFLGANPSTRRLYERAKAAMLADTPPDFTLIQAVGPQAGAVFSRASHQPLASGISGIFTYDGYHDVFDKYLSEFVGQAKLDDAWVMGDTSKSVGDAAKTTLKNDPLIQDIRRQYLEEYTQQWTMFLEDVRAVTGSNLSFDVTILRAFAAPDSPLSRLARAAARETTLSRPLSAKSETDKNFLDKAADKLNQKSRDVLGTSVQERQERELVDNHFAALREVVTGQADAGLMQATPAGDTSKPGLDNIASLLNAYYTLLVVADNALNSKNLPSNSLDAGTNLKLEGDKLPAPFNAILTGLANSGVQKIADGSAAILRVQAQQQVDQINDMLSSQVGSVCRQTIAGRYPFAASTQEVSLDDFARVFGAGNAADTFFQKQLAPFVDMSRRPWRYKAPGVTNLLSPADAMTAVAGTPATSSNAGPSLLSEMLKLLAKEGPNPEHFAQVQAIHDTFFQDPDSKKVAWKVHMRINELDPTITELIMDFDGHPERYSHGPVRPFTINWPGPNGGRSAEIRATPSVRPETSGIMANGPWALFRLLERGTLSKTGVIGRSTVTFDVDGRKARIGLDMGNLPNPLMSDVLRGFVCPGRI